MHMPDSASPASPVTVVPVTDDEAAGGSRGAGAASASDEDGGARLPTERYDVTRYRDEVSRLLIYGYPRNCTWSNVLVPFIYGTTCPDRIQALRVVHHDLGLPDEAITYMMNWWQSVGVATPRQACEYICKPLRELVTLPNQNGAGW